MKTTTKSDSYESSAKLSFYSMIAITLFMIITVLHSCVTDDEDENQSNIQQEELLSCGFEMTENDMENLLSSNDVNYDLRTTGIKQVPVSLNIIRRDDGSGGLTNSEIYQQFYDLNILYEPAGLEFIICDDINFVDSSEYYVADASDQYALRQLYNKDNILNIYVPGDVVLSGSSYCGFAYYPGGLEVVWLRNSCFRNGSTLPHEIGHFFGLIHTHGASNSPNSTEELADGSNGIVSGDYIQDTPSDPKLSGYVDNYCNYTGDFLDNNGESHVPDPNNIMSYSLKTCRNYFSQGQLDKINIVSNTSRNNLVCESTPPPPPLGSINNPIIINPNLTRNKVYKNGYCETGEDIIYYESPTDLYLNDFKLTVRGNVKLTVNGDIIGSNLSKVIAKKCGQICVTGIVDVVSKTSMGGTINADCGTPIGTINHPKIIDPNFNRNRSSKNGNCNSDLNIKYLKKYGDLNLQEFNYTVKGKINLVVEGDVIGSDTSILKSKDCAIVTVNGNINIQTQTSNNGVINN